MKISNNGLRLIESFEGFQSCPYYDIYGKVWSRGFGETDWNGNFGGKCISRSEAENNLRSQVDNNYGKAVNDLCVPLNQNQFDALCSFVYNLGTGSLEWDVGRSLRERKYDQAANQMLQYDTAGGQVLPGLVTRRREERALFLTPTGPPPKPPNPLNVLYPEERRVVNSYLAYAKHPRLHPHGIKVTKQEMANMRGNIWDAAEYGRLKSGQKVQKGWHINNRIARYDLLKKYST